MARITKESQGYNFGHEAAVDVGVSESPLVSVAISNYNYERFLGEAVDSALNQTYPNVEVVVVDDGSTDGSREIIASYGDRIVPVLKGNGGQASACNAGFRASKGEITIFFDADDVLLPDTVGRVVEAFRSRTGVAKVQYRQRIVDTSGRYTGRNQLPDHVRMQSGDLRPQVLEDGQYAWPSTSGNAFASAVLRRILPIPEDLCRGFPDIHLCNLSAIFGPVITLDEPGSLYRIHGRNAYYGSYGFMNSTSLDKLRKILVAVADNHARQRRLFKELYSVEARNAEPRDLHFLCEKMISLKLDHRNHPFGENLLSLFIRGCVLSAIHPDPNLYKYVRLLYIAWFTVMLLAPKPLARSLAEMVYYSERRGRLYGKLLPLLRWFS